MPHSTRSICQRTREWLADGDARPFLTFVDQRGSAHELSYGEFDKYARRIAARLLELGCKRGDKVLFCRSHSVVLLASIAGCLLAGIVPVVFASPSQKFSTENYLEMIRTLSSQLQPDMAVIDDHVLKVVRDIFPFKLVGGSSFAPGYLRKILGIRGAKFQAPKDSVALIQYSSRTTGLKKGAVLTETALLDQVDNYAAALNMSSDDRIASWLPLYHDMGLVAGFVMSWILGLPIVSMSPFDWLIRPEFFLKTVTASRSTLMWQPNFAFSHLARLFQGKDLSGIDLSSLRMVINCSEPITESAHAAFLDVFAACGISDRQLATCYAMAETTFAVTNSVANSTPVKKAVAPASLGLGEAVRPGEMTLVSSGRAIPGTKVEIVDESGRPRETGIVGEIRIASESMMSCYLGIDPSETFTTERSYPTGDVGFLQGGELFVLGRKDDTLIVRGQNVYPQSVEELVSLVSGVVPGRCVAFGSRLFSKDSEDLIILAESRETDARQRSTIAARITASIAKVLDVPPRES